MSNPAVIKLQQKKIGNSRIWLDDNFGESIHIHIDDIRVDLTNSEFDKMYFDVCEAINSLVDIDGFDCHKIDPIFFEVMLTDNIIKLQKVKRDKMKLGDMFAPGRNGISPLPESRAVHALQGDSTENDGKRLSNHIGQTSQQRLDMMMESIKKRGYPIDEQYIVFYGDDSIIRDGQHRAACLYYLFGNIEVPVIRYYFEDYKPENIKLSKYKCYRYYQQMAEHLKRIHNFRDILADFKHLLRPVLHKMKSSKSRISIKKAGAEYERAKLILDRK